MLKTGIVSSAYFRYDDYKNGILDMKNDGYDCCDYHGFIHADSPLYRYSKQEFEAYLTEVLKYAVDHGIVFCQLHAQWPLKCTTSEEIVQSLEIVKKSIVGASILNCPSVVVHTFAPYGWLKEVDREKTFQKNVEIFALLSNYAKNYDVNICIENLPFKNLEISRVNEVIKLIDAVGYNNCKMCFDVGHAHVFHDDLFEDIIKIGSRLLVLHVHDNNGHYDSHMIPWQGTIDWQRFSHALKKINFNGCISLETYIDNDMPLQFKSKMRKILADIAKNIADI